jgi:hypothetical protein
MVSDDDLHVRKLGTIPMQERKEPMHGGLILVFKPVNPPVLVALGRVMRLRGLIEHKKGGDRTPPSPEQAVETQMCRDMIADPVFSAAHLSERKRTVVGVRYDRQVLDVKTKRVGAMLKAEFKCKGGKVTPDQIQSCDQPLLRGIVVDRPLKLFDFRSELVDLTREIAVRRNSPGVLKVIGDSARDPRLFGELMLF